jgi:hypothetical protein
LDNNFEDYPVRYPLLFDHRHYVPRLLWKQGEYQALVHLHLHSKTDVTPLIDIPEIGYDFETGEDAKTVDEHLSKFGKRLSDKWSERWAFVDLALIDPIERMKDRRHPLKFVFDEVRNQHALAIPVTGLSRDSAYQQAVFDVISTDKSGVCIRLKIEDVVAAQFTARLNALLTRLNLAHHACHLILDLGAPNFEPLDGFTKMVRGLINRLPQISEWQTFTICGTAFPQTMGQLKPGVHIIKRYEWLFYKRLLSLLEKRDRKPTFGDYAIAHPEHERKDPRLLKPAASIRYAIDDAWYIVKGSNVRENGTAQYIKYCNELIRSGLFRGADFSDAGRYIRGCAQRRLTPGNLTTWRRIGTNHHIEKVVFDLANLNGS